MSSVSVPASGAQLSEVMRFATTTYFGDDRHGGVVAFSALANSAIERWRQSRELPGSVQIIRASLFFESRRLIDDLIASFETLFDEAFAPDCSDRVARARREILDES